MSPYRFKALRAKLDLPQVGERVRSKRYGTVWKIIEEKETWIPVPAHLRGLWFPDGKMPAIVVRFRKEDSAKGPEPERP
ncbi:hypothetical protein [Desulfosoma sp.]|uniref:hypothetical protein n=1 Tax=Desulfosoma sp. TaxID=2603217 RepID=UPI0040490341